jgi:hypothetical protein
MITASIIRAIALINLYQTAQHPRRRSSARDSAVYPASPHEAWKTSLCALQSASQGVRKRVTYLVLVLVQFGVRRAVFAHLLLALVARTEEVVWFEALQTDPAAPCATRGLTGLRFPANTQDGDHLSDPYLINSMTQS